MSAKGMTDLTTHDFENETLRKPGLWLVDFGAAWCPPCRVLDAVLGPLSESYVGRLTMGAVNIDENEEVTERFKITAAPTMLLFRDGELIDRRVGAVSKSALVTWLERAMG